MKLSEMSGQSPELKVLVYGPSGAGKTCFASTFPGPILILDFDGKANSIINFLGKDNKKLEEIEVEDFRAQLIDDPIAKFIQLTRRLEQEIKEKKFKWKTIVLDSLTTFSASALAHIVKTNPGVKRPIFAQGPQPVVQDYGILKREFARIIPGFIGLPANVIMLGHIKTDKDEITGEILREVQLDGSFGGQLPIFFEEVYVAQINGKGERSLLTDGKGRYPCRTQRSLPAEIAMSYEGIMQGTGKKS